MKRYQSVPVIIEADQWLGKNASDVEAFCERNEIYPVFTYGLVDGHKGMIIKAHGGNVIARRTDFVVRGMEGEYYPCIATVFRMKYKLIEV